MKKLLLTTLTMLTLSQPVFVGERMAKDDVSSNYYDCWTYLNEIIDIVSYNASNWLLDKLYEDRDYYQNKYLTIKGLK